MVQHRHEFENECVKYGNIFETLYYWTFIKISEIKLMNQVLHFQSYSKDKNKHVKFSIYTPKDSIYFTDRKNGFYKIHIRRNVKISLFQ